MEGFYFQLFSEAYLRYFPVPLGSQIVLSAMKEFGGYDLLIPNLLTGAGILLAIMTSFMIGLGLGALRPKYFSTAIPDAAYRRLNVHARRYGWLLLPLVGLPFGTIIPLVIGFFWRKLNRSVITFN